jgi:hypothetical protein
MSRRRGRGVGAGGGTDGSVGFAGCLLAWRRGEERER